jgi:HlyD family secretion protein
MLVSVTASGSIEPEAQISLAFETPGQVEQVAVAVGDEVAASEALAKLDTQELVLQVHQAEAGLAAAEAQLIQLEEGPRSGDVALAAANLDAANAQVSAATANRDQVASRAGADEIAAAEAQVASAQLQWRIADNAYNEARGSNADEDRIEAAAYDLYVARESLKAAEARLAELRSGPDPEQVRAAQSDLQAAAAQRDAAQANLDLLSAGPQEAQVADAEAQVRQARAALALAELSLERATLRAPFDGVISVLNVEVGELASPGLPAFVLLDISQFHLPVRVDELDVGRLSKGQAAEVTVDAFPDIVIPATVERIAPVATPEGGVTYYEVIIALSDSDVDVPIRADMTANATIVVEQFEDVLQIPTWIVRVDRLSGQTYVHRRNGEEFERVDVTLGVRYEGMVQVLGGLDEGEEIAWVEESNGLGFSFGGQ